MEYSKNMIYISITQWLLDRILAKGIEGKSLDIIYETTTKI